MTIDWHFIAALEGAGILTGYVPVAETSNSGVTIASGVDLGQTGPRQIDFWPIDDALKMRLRLYCGLKRQDAVDFLRAHPLTISPGECAEIDAAVQAEQASRIAVAYDKASVVKFADLPDRAQTVIVSLAFQYGTDLAHRCPRFWHTALAQDWPAMVRELENFGDAYGPRRLREARHLAPLVDNRPRSAAVAG
jgi:hypothetical protein